VSVSSSPQAVADLLPGASRDDAHRLARFVIGAKNPQAKVGANPFVLGLPGLLQFFIDLMANPNKYG
jgi:hypothetical protein